MIKLAISGCKGKMGDRITQLAKLDNGFRVVVLLERRGHPDIGKNAGEIEITDNPDKIKLADILIDFSSPEATIGHLNYCLKYKRAVVIGTTGLLQDQKEKISSAARKIPVIFSPNMSVGVNLLFRLVKEAAIALSEDYKINITEAHHIHKKDAPSGTAKELARIISEARKEEVKDIKSVRENEIVGDHEVVFDSPLDTIKLSHSAKTRDIFAEGALSAAKWLIKTKKKKGLFDMQNILSRK